MTTAAHVARSILTIDRSMTRSLQRTILIGYPDEQSAKAALSYRGHLAFALFKTVEAAQYALDALRAQQLFQRKTSEAGGSAYSPQRELHVDFARFSSHFLRADDLTSPQDQEREGGLPWKTAWIDDDESGAAWRYVDEGAPCQEWKRGQTLPDDANEHQIGQSTDLSTQHKQTNGASVHKRQKDVTSSNSSSSLAAQAHLVGGKKKAAHNIANWAKKQEELHGGAKAPPQVAAEASTSEGTAASPKKWPALAAAASTLAGPSSHTKTKTTPDPASAVTAVSRPSSSPSATVTTAESFTDPRPAVLACYLCARRFKTPTILARHEAESELHRGNLADEGKKREARERRREAEAKERGEQEAKAVPESSAKGSEERDGGSGSTETPAAQSLSDAATSSATATATAASPPPQSQYRDRALERRAAFGVDESALKEAKRAKRYHPYEQQTRIFVPGPEAPPAAPIPPQPQSEPQPAGGRALDTSNVGHAMLLAMGWTAGSGLGEGERQGRVEPVEAALSHLGGEERAGIGAAANRERTTVAPGAVAWQTSMLERAREARRRRYEASGGDGGDEKEKQHEQGR